MIEAHSNPRVSRRALAAGAAWSVPVVGLTSATPALAASYGPIITGNVCQLFYGKGDINKQEHSIFLGVTSSSGTIPAATVVSWTVCVDPITNPDGGTTWTLPTREYPQGTSATDTSGDWFFSYETATASPSIPGTALSIGASQTGAKCFVVKVTFNKARTTSFCAAIVWTDIYTLRPASTITITSNGYISGPAQGGGTGGLKYKAARRYPTTIKTSGRTPHIFQSKSGSQTCWPPVSTAVGMQSDGADDVVCYPAKPSGLTTPCSWNGKMCDSDPAGVCTPPYTAAVAGQTNIPQYC